LEKKLIIQKVKEKKPERNANAFFCLSQLIATMSDF
jgi:hypothetical protein